MLESCKKMEHLLDDGLPFSPQFDAHIQDDERDNLVQKVEIELPDDRADNERHALLFKKVDNAVAPDVPRHAVRNEPAYHHRDGDGKNRDKKTRRRCAKERVEVFFSRENADRNGDGNACQPIDIRGCFCRAVQDIHGYTDDGSAERTEHIRCKNRSE